MALGSSAPEILLSVIEVCGNGFKAGDLGPNTIVGSAAYNLFIIIAYCIFVVPAGEVRRIKHLRVFFVTAGWSIFAYIWLYVIISVSSKGVIEPWEAILTFFFFPLTVGTAYVVDRKIFFINFLGKKVTATKVLKGADGVGIENSQPALPYDVEQGSESVPNLSSFDLSTISNPEIKSFEEHRREYINILHELRQQHPDINIEELQNLAELEIMKRGPKSRAYYRIQATRKLIGSSSIVQKKREAMKSALKNSESKSLSNIVEESDNITTVFFDPAHYTCFESVGEIKIYVRRGGADLQSTLLVDYRTESGSAQSGSDFVHTEGTLAFFPGETIREFSVVIIDDDVYEEDEHFYVHLSNLRYKDQVINESTPLDSKLELLGPATATVMILDDDHGGIFMFSEEKQEIVENAGQVNVKVLRTSGARGRVLVPYKTVNGTAIGGKDFEAKEDFLIFENNETE
jgi:solute carrier family 8 (sodium/calcium exchanger)